MGSVLEFSDADSVGAYFGTGSEEYARAAFYFAWVSKQDTSPQKISFMRWPNVATAPQVFGNKNLTQALASYTSITAGTFVLTMGSEANITLGPINFSSAASLGDVAADIQTAIRAHTAGATLWTAATVTWDSVNNRFDITGGLTGAAAIDVSAGAGGSDISAQLGWNDVNTILSPGSAAQTLTNLLIQSSQISNNFGTFLFIPALNQTQIVEVATWNDGQNVDFMYLVPVSASNAAAISTAIFGYAGCAITLSIFTGEYPEMAPGLVLAATDYEARSSVQNYMFQKFPTLTASVTDELTSDNYDAIRVNYIGNTQTAGQILSFYQRGDLTGGDQSPLDQNTYANEMWFKDAAAAAILTLLLSLGRVPANKYGETQILSALQDPIDTALFNGTISVGRILTSAQRAFITNVSGDNTTWQTVQNIGYWRDVVIEPVVTEDGRTEYKAVYTLIYAQDDDIRKVEGVHDLI